MAYIWDNSLTAESTEDFCSQVFIKMFITTIQRLLSYALIFWRERKDEERCGPGKKMCLERTFPRMPTGRGEVKGWSWASPNLCPQMQG